MLMIFLDAAGRMYCLAQHYLGRRFGPLRTREQSVVHLGVDADQESDCPITLTQDSRMAILEDAALAVDLLKDS